jgi:hypothetical protein
MKNLVSILILMMMAYMAQAQCNASFTATQIGSYIVFNNTSSIGPAVNGYGSYVYSFGDGTPSQTTWSNMQITHLYTPGTYTVTLTQQVTDSMTQAIICTSTYTSAVTVGASTICGSLLPPNATASVNVGNNYVFSLSSSNASSIPSIVDYAVLYSVDYGDGTAPGSGVAYQAPSFAYGLNHTYSAAGTYTATVTESIIDFASQNNVFCTTTNTIVVTVGASTNLCNTLLSVSNTPLGNGIYQFINTSAVPNISFPYYHYYSLYIDGGLASFMGNGSSYNHLFTTTGVHTINLVMNIEDSTTLSTVCTTSVTYTINVTSSFSPITDSTGCIANFTFEPDSSSLTILFSAENSGYNNTMSITNCSWNFGDGATASGPSIYTNHTYAAAGTYNVCLTITTQGGGTVCTSVVCYDVLVQNLNPTLSGSILALTYAFSGAITPTHSTIYILKLDNITNQLNLIASKYTGSGSTAYIFNLVPGTYLVKAATNNYLSNVSNIVLPTYAQSAALWSGATSIAVGAGNNPVTIDYLFGAPPAGSGLITGSVLLGANKTRGVGDGKPGLNVYLLDANSKAIKCVVTDTGGHYKFDGLAMGNYKIYVDEINKTMTPANIVLSTTNPAALKTDFISNSKSNYPAWASNISTVTSINNVAVYPNPATNSLFINGGKAWDKVQVFAMDGSVVLSNAGLAINKALDISILPVGNYIIKASNADGVATAQFTK